MAFHVLFLDILLETTPNTVREMGCDSYFILHYIYPE